MIDMSRAFKAAELCSHGSLEKDELDDFARYYKYVDFAEMADAACTYMEESPMMDANHPGIKNLAEFMKRL